ncbi:MAG: cell division protein FtsZ [Bacteroidales bacterium]|nr:cell division protein FtsZ [Bacteroidales bacterium]
MEELMQFASEITENNLLSMDAPKEQSSYIKVLGVGGAGTNAVNHMFNCGIQGVDFIVCNTDQSSLDNSPVLNKIKIGEGGLGAGNNPEKARVAAEAAEEEIKSHLEHNTRMLFITAGMGGGTGTGASPIIARFAKEVKIATTEEQILVVAVVTLPFSFEGRRRKQQAQEGILKLREEVDAIITINTDKLREYGNLTMDNAFTMADDILLTAAKGISEMMTVTGRTRVDFRDVQSVMQKSGVALMGTGVAEGENRALEAIQAATTSKLLNDDDISKTKNILLYFLSSESNQLRMEEMDIIVNYIQQATNPDVDYIWGTGVDNSLGDKLSITLVATGFEAKPPQQPVERGHDKIPLPTPTHPQNTPISQPPKIDDIIEVSQVTQSVVQQPPQVSQTEEPAQISQESEKIVHVLPITEEPIVDTQTQTIVTTDTKLTGIWQQSSVAVNPQPLPQSQPQQIMVKEPVVEVQSTPEVTTDINKIFVNTGFQNISDDERMERMRAVREMLNSEAGIEKLIATSPLEIETMNFNQEFSQANKSSSFSITSDGDLKYGANPSLHACVD